MKKQLINEAIRFQQLAGIEPINSLNEEDKIKDMKINFKVLERIDSLILIGEMKNFKESLTIMADDLLKEGFDYDQIKAYFQLILEEQLGDQ
jgi:hypothetical protein